MKRAIRMVGSGGLETSRRFAQQRDLSPGLQAPLLADIQKETVKVDANGYRAAIKKAGIFLSDHCRIASFENSMIFEARRE